MKTRRASFRKSVARDYRIEVGKPFVALAEISVVVFPPTI